MATWMVHLRIADGIMKEIPKLERQEFISRQRSTE